MTDRINKEEVKEILENKEMIKNAIRENLSELEHWAYVRSTDGNSVYLASSESGNLAFFFINIPIGYVAVGNFKQNEHTAIALLNVEIDLCENDFAVNLLKNTKDKEGAKEIQKYIEQNPCAWYNLGDEKCEKVYNEEDYDNGVYYDDARGEIVDKLRNLDDYLVFLEKELEKEGILDDLTEWLINNARLFNEN